MIEVPLYSLDSGHGPHQLSDRAGFALGAMGTLIDPELVV